MSGSGRSIAKLTLIDTDILIDVGRGIAEASNYLERIEQNSQLAISTITHMELIIGCGNKAELKALDEFLSKFTVIQLSGRISNKATSLLHQYRLSHGLLIPDALIAATAITIDQPFVSKNQRDYRFIPDLDLLAYP